MIIAGVFVLLTLAVARFTRVIVSDRIALGLRRWAVNKYGEESLRAYLLHCTWCTSFWAAFPAGIIWALTTLPWQWWWLALPGWLAMSYLTGLLARLEGE